MNQHTIDTALQMEERDYIIQVLSDPKAPRTMYIYWLTTNGQLIKADFLNELDKPQPDWDKIHELAKGLDPQWLVVVADAIIVNCGRFDPVEYEQTAAWFKISNRPYGNPPHTIHKESTVDEWRANHPRSRYEFICPLTWRDLKPTDDPKVRHCDKCDENVHYATDIIDARKLINGTWDNGKCHEKPKCVAIDPGIERRKDDLIGELAIFGRPSKKSLHEEAMRCKPDHVSEARLKAEGTHVYVWEYVEKDGTTEVEYSKCLPRDQAVHQCRPRTDDYKWRYWQWAEIGQDPPPPRLAQPCSDKEQGESNDRSETGDQPNHV